MSNLQSVLHLGPSVGSSTYVSIPITAKFQFSNQSLTLMIWHQLDPEDSSLISGEKFLIGTSTFGLRILKGQYVWGFISGATATANVPDGDGGTWVHLCAQYDITKRQWLLYRNSHLLASSNSRVPATTDLIWYLGGRPDLTATSSGLSLGPTWLFGSLVSITNLRTLYMPYRGRSPSSSSDDTLIGYWPLNDGLGTVIEDCSGVAPFASGSFTAASLKWQTAAWISNFVFVDLGQSIAASLQNIQNASQLKPYNIYTSHGDFTQQVVMKPWTNLIGSGVGLTAIDVTAGSVAPFGSVILANNVSLRQLDIFGTAVSGASNVCGVEISDVCIVAQLNNINIYCDGNGFAVIVKGLSILNALKGTQLSLTESRLQTTGGSADTVIVNQNASLVLNNCTVESLSPLDATSVGLISTQGSTSFSNCQITSPNIAVYGQIGSNTELQNCQIVGSKGSLMTYSNGQITATKCKISGRVQGNVVINQ